MKTKRRRTKVGVFILFFAEPKTNTETSKNKKQILSEIDTYQIQREYRAMRILAGIKGIIESCKKKSKTFKQDNKVIFDFSGVSDLLWNRETSNY
jgi:hypothetical protein